MAWTEVCSQLDSLLAGLQGPSDEARTAAALNGWEGGIAQAREGPGPSPKEREQADEVPTLP